MIGVKKHGSTEYTVAHILDPQQHNPRSKMSKTLLDAAEMELLLMYLFTLA